MRFQYVIVDEADTDTVELHLITHCVEDVGWIPWLDGSKIYRIAESEVAKLPLATESTRHVFGYVLRSTEEIAQVLPQPEAGTWLVIMTSDEEHVPREHAQPNA